MWFVYISFDKLDYLLYGWEHEIPADQAAPVLDLTEESVKRAYKDFTSKNRATAHIRAMPNTLE